MLRERRPTWELADLLIPYQGDWTPKQYLALDTPRYIEFTDGFLDFLPSPDEVHCKVQTFLLSAVRSFVSTTGHGKAMFSPFTVRLRAGAFRKPDICVLLDEHDPRRARLYWSGADVVMEVVSAGGEARDYEQKRIEYAAAAIPEYWLVDPSRREIVLFRLAGREYVEQTFRPGQVVESLTMNGFRIDVAECFAVAKFAAPNDEPIVGRLEN